MKYFQQLPATNDFVNHPDYDAFWKRQAFAPWLNRVTVPTLNVAGFMGSGRLLWPGEDLRIARTPRLPRTKTSSSSARGITAAGRAATGKTGPHYSGSATAAYYRREVLSRFLAYHLKAKARSTCPKRLRSRTGANQWARHDAWPPVRNVNARRLYLQANSRLSFDRRPPAPNRRLTVTFPTRRIPVPYRPRPIEVRSGWST
ncbi:MAG: hypothetical protein IPO77_07940 [Acidobacteria bacterium]|nr:hypothetical protein [Acidobacteriota bacterium]